MCEHEFYLVERMAYDVILETDFMAKMQIIMRCGDSYEFGREDGTITLLAISEARLEEVLNEKAEMFNGEFGCVNHYKH